MQRRIDESSNPGQRPVMPGERFPRVLNTGGPQRFDVSDGQMPSPLQYTPLSVFSQIGQAPQHLQSAQANVHPSVAAATLSSVHQAIVAQPPNIHQPPAVQSSTAQGGLSGPGVGQQQQQQFQRLKVEDALSYLDQVKLQFGNQPSVYNDFLDIMKEFKSQTIDTPGVINRVSNLFKGHPDLIVGFNTFLPPGYKIEVERDVINVYQPGQASMPISALGISTGTSLSQQLQSQVQKSPAHLGAVAVPPPLPVPPPAVHHSYTQPPRTALVDAHLPLPHQATPVAGIPVAPSQGGGNQPVEFNHAINYVNKIKNRFQGQPEVYKQFLEILHTYQKEQRTIKEGMGSVSNKPLTETEVYQQVARLFQNQEDLLTEFGQFLPDANGQGGYFFGDSTEGRRSSSDMVLGVRNDHSSTVKKPGCTGKTAPPGKTSSQLKRPQMGGSSSLQPPSKMRRPDYFDEMPRSGEGVKYKTGMLKDVSIAEAGKCGSLKEYAFFDQVRNALRSNEVYNNFLRCLVLFNMEVISRSELINMVHPFLGKYPDLLKFFKELLGHKDCGNLSEIIPQGVTKDRGMRDDSNMEIDFQTCKRYGASYRALPSSYIQPKCSGRTQLCREVLNDTWVSIPTWSEDSTFVTSRKSMFEEQIYKTEDERFELDMVIETNLAAIKTLEYISKKMQRMTPEEAAKFRLDNSLGGSSEFVARKAIIRIYGEKSADIIDGLKKNPVVAVPLVLRRLKAKDEEWCDAKKGFNKLWQEQNQKYYLKSLDHQGIAFKQNDIKALRSKALINEIESIMEEQTEANQQGQSMEMPDPHIRENYEDKAVFHDAASIIIHNMKRQSNMHHDDKKKIKQLVLHHFRHFLFHPRGDLSDDEDDGDEDGDGEKPGDTASSDSMSRPVPKEKELTSASETQLNGHCTPPAHADTSAESSQQGTSDSADLDTVEDDDDQYILFFANTNWYLFFRLHFKLCQRLLLYRKMSEDLAAQEESSKESRKPSTAIALRLKTPFDVTPDQYYTFFIECIKNLLDGNMEASTYEDNLREMFGIHAFHAYTMDKLVISIVRVLHHLVSDECVEILDMYHEEQRSGATGGPVSTQSSRLQAELNYQRRAETLLADDNCCKFIFYKKSGDVCITLLDQNLEQGEEVAETERWASYIERYISMTPTDGQQKFSDKMVKILRQKPLFMSRNISSWRRANLSPRRNEEEDDDDQEDSDDREDVSSHALEMVQDVNDGKTMVSDGGGIRFTVNSLKMHHISWGSEMLYRRKALDSAKNTHRTVSLTKHRKFTKWLDNCEWRQDLDKPENCNMEDDCHDWMMGKGEDISPNTTTTLTLRNEPPVKSPYYAYHHYRVRRIAPPPQPVGASLTSSVQPSSFSAGSAAAHVMSLPSLLMYANTTTSPLEVLGSRPGSRPVSRPCSRPSTPAE